MIWAMTVSRLSVAFIPCFPAETEMYVTPPRSYLRMQRYELLCNSAIPKNDDLNKKLTKYK